MRCQPKNPLTPPPLISFLHMSQIPTIMLLVTFMNFPPLSISSLHETFRAFLPIYFFSTRDPRAFLPHSFFFYAWVQFPPTQFKLPLPSPLYTQVGFPQTQFLVPFHLLFVHGSSSPDLILSPFFVSFLHTGRIPPQPNSWSPFHLLCAWVGFSSDRFLVPLPFPFRALIEFLLTWFPFTFLCCKSMVPNMKL